MPELLDDLAADRTIFIAEGERKVDLLRGWNIPATCNAMGAAVGKDGSKKWRLEFSECLRNADVVFLPDNDENGRGHVETVAPSLVAAGARVRVLDVPGLGPKCDIVDWAAAGGTAEGLLELVESDARQWVPAPEPNGETEPFFDPNPNYDPPGNNTIPPPPDRDSLSIASWLKRDIPPRDYLLGGVLCTTSRWLVFGETGVGKTPLAVDLGAAAASAMEFLKWPGQRTARVMYLDGELPIETFKERIKQAVRKARLRTPANADQFAPLIIRPGADWSVTAAPKNTAPKGRASTQKIVEREFVFAYDRLADGVTVKSHGLDGKLVLKVPVDAIRDELKSRGLLERDEKTGSLTRAARTMLYKAKSALVSANAPLAEKDGLIWRK